MRVCVRFRAVQFLAAIAAAFGFVGTAQAQRVEVNVGSVTTTQSCTYYRNYEGTQLTYSEAEYARYWGAAAARTYYAAHTTWRSYVVADCEDNFPAFRATLDAALASTGRLVTGRGGYTINVTISDIGETPPATRQPVRGDTAYRTSWGSAMVTASFTILADDGSSVDGGVLTKRIEMSRTLDTNRIAVSTAQPGESVYDLIQNELALAIARDVTFAIDPIMVIAVEDDLVELNYGRPLLDVGDRLDVRRTRGILPLRYRVISVSETDAVAQMDGDNDYSDIEPGNEATYVEEDSDAANSRRLRRRRLP